jgi:Proprotein convertase P-domain./FG-GAP repeat.
MPASWRNLRRILLGAYYSRRQNPFAPGAVLDALPRNVRRSADRISGHRSALIEQLEDRTLLSVLPLPTIGTRSIIAGGDTPMVVIDPINPNKLVAVYNTGTSVGMSYSINGGATWAGWSPVALTTLENFSDPTIAYTGLSPTTPIGTPYAQSDDASVSIDRQENIYVLSREHNVANTAGALVLNRFTWANIDVPVIGDGIYGNTEIGSSNVHVALTGDIGNDVSYLKSDGITTAYRGKILYEWVDDPAVQPMLVVDNNPRVFTDPQTGATQTDPNVDPVTGQGPIYAAWSVTDAAFTTGTIRIMASSNGGISFTPAGTVSVGAATSPRLVVSAGTADNRVQAGQVTVVWDDGSSIKADRILDGGKGAVVQKVANVTLVDATSAEAQAFKAKLDVATGHGPQSAASADFNSDGKADLVVANTTDNSLSVLQGDGVGGFVPYAGSPIVLTATLAGAKNPVAVKVGDFNKDGNFDIIVATDAGVLLLSGLGAGAFSPPVLIRAGANFKSVAIADLNGDGNLDIVAANSVTNTISTILGNGDGTFKASQDFNVGGTGPVAVAIGDINGDTLPDIVTVNVTTGNISVFLPTVNALTGVWSAGAATVFAVGTAPRDVAFVSYGGKNNLAVTFNGGVAGAGVALLANNTLPAPGSPPAFAAPVTVATVNPYGIVVADFTRDGNLDMAVTNHDGATVTLLTGDGAGVFTAIVPGFAVGTTPVALTTADFDGDGHPDLAVVNSGSNNVSILLENTSAAVVTGVTKSFLTVTAANVANLDAAVKLDNFTFSINLFNSDISGKQVWLTSPGGVKVLMLGNRQGYDPITGELTTFPAQGNTGTGLGVGDSGLTIGTVFDDAGQRNINAAGGGTTHIGHVIPDDLGFGAPLGGAMYQFVGSAVNVTDPITGTTKLVKTGLLPSQMVGTWTVEIDTVVSLPNPIPDNPPLDPHPQVLVDWTLNFGQNDTPQGNVGVATSSFSGAVVAPYLTPNISPIPPSISTASAAIGIGPQATVTSDNTYGSFSPYQGRLYVAYDDNGGTGSNNPGDNSDIYVVYSDDGGITWTGTFDHPAVKINNDNGLIDGFSEGTRPQYTPSLAVDSTTGTLVVTWFDARFDPSRARVATYISTSIDGANTFGPQTFLNQPNTATDAITGKTVVLGPIPGNQGALGDATAPGFGNRQGLAVQGGHVYALWGGNFNGGREGSDISSSILSAQVTIAAGPRIVASDMGPITTDMRMLTTGTLYDNTFASDGTRQIDGFTVTFDRPIDPTTFLASDVAMLFRDPSKTGFDPGTAVAIASIVPLDAYANRYFGGIQNAEGQRELFGPTPALGAPDLRVQSGVASVNGFGVVQLATQFFVKFATAQAGIGTYSYSIASRNIRDRIRSLAATTLYYAPPAQLNLRIPSSGTGGAGAAADVTTSTITIASVPATQQIVDLNVNLSLNHSNVSNLVVELISPSGTVVKLLNGVSGNFNGIKPVRNFSDTTISDGAADIASAYAPFTGTFSPAIGLSVLDGFTPNGTWTLRITDGTRFDTGTLLSWSMQVTTRDTTDLAVQRGNLMDQNGNALAGEDPAGDHRAGEAQLINGTAPGDVYAAPQADPSTTHIFTSDTIAPGYNASTLPLIVPGPHLQESHVYAAFTGSPAAPNTLLNLPVPAVGSGDTQNPAQDVTTSSITINGDPFNQVTSLKLNLKLDHSSTKDLVITLTGPDGTKITLLSNEVGIGRTTTNVSLNLSDMTFSDGSDGVNVIERFPGDPSYVPLAYDPLFNNIIHSYDLNVTGIGGLASFNHKSLNGTWTLAIEDNVNLDSGTLLGWSLEAQTERVATTQAVSQFHLYFDRSMDPTLLNASDIVRLVGPAGQVLPSQTFVSTDINHQINDATGSLVSTLMIPDNADFTLADLNVSLSITHPRDSDLTAQLIGPDGTTITLFANVGGSGANFTNTIFDDTAQQNIGTTTTTAAPFSQRLQPAQSLAHFKGKALHGTWKLVLSDSLAGQTGVLNAWSLTATPDNVAIKIVPDPAADANYPDPSGQNRSFLVTIPTQYLNGTYSLVLGSVKSVTASNGSVTTTPILDSNLNAGLASLRDEVPVQAPIKLTTRSSTDTALNAGGASGFVPVDLIPLGEVTSTLQWDASKLGSFQIQDVSVKIAITTTNDPDLVVSLIAPDGTEVQLVAQNTGYFGTRVNFTNTVFSDSALGSIDSGQAPFTGSYIPNQPLSTFTNHFSAGSAGSGIGDWTLRVLDHGNATSGTITGWSLTLTQSLSTKDTLYKSVNVPQTIPSHGTTVSTITVNDSYLLQNLTLQLNATYPNDPNLKATLLTPWGETVSLFDIGNGGTTSTHANFTNTVFDDRTSVTSSITEGSAPFFGRYNTQPTASLPLTFLTWPTAPIASTAFGR